MKAGILGYRGRVGQLIVRELKSGDYPDMELAGGTSRHVAKESNTGDSGNVFITADPTVLFKTADILIDFTLPEASMTHVDIAARTGKPLVIGTTGFSSAQEAQIADAAQNAPILLAANMSIGVNMLIALVGQAAARLGIEWDIEISETHHKHKIDAPSGTAIALGKRVASARDTKLKINTDRNGKRESGDIGFAVQRGGDVVGEHVVSFFSEGERLQFSHMASDRNLFAKGALRAARWLHDKPNGLYDMHDALAL